MLELILCIIESSLDKKKREAAKALSFIFASEKFFLRETDYFGIEQKHGSSSTNAFAFLLCFLYFSSGRVTRQFYDPWEKSGEALLLLSLIGF